MSRSVVVTGVGLITPLAADVNNTWSKLKEGKSVIKAINTDRFESSDLACHVPGQVPVQSNNLEHYFNPPGWLNYSTSSRR